MLLILRIPLICIWIMITTAIGIVACIVRPFNPKNVRVTTRLLQYGRYILGLKIILRGEQIMNDNRPCVFISNHQDNLDIFAGAMALPKRTVSIGKRDILFVPFFGLYYWLSGNILINRGNKRQAFETMDIAAGIIKNKKISIWIMPEGTRSKGKGLLPFKKGPFITAIKAGVPILPVAWSNYIIEGVNLNKWHSGTLIMQALDPIPTTGLTIQDAGMLKDKAYDLMKAAIEKLDVEVKIMHKSRE